MRRAGKPNSKWWAVIGCTLLAGEALLRVPVIFAADAVKDADLKAEIVYRCYNQMGEFGVEGVRVCVDGELSAMKALSSYPQEAAEIVQRCTRRLQSIGWEMVKSCADKDIAAERDARKD